MAALPTLATLADLKHSKVVFDDEDTAQVMLSRASAAVRDAAGTTITKATSTIRIATEASRRIELPGSPVRGINSVHLDGERVTFWYLLGSELWRDVPWQVQGAPPSVLEITYVHGHDVVPADIKSLVCSLTAAGLRAAEQGYDPARGLTYERIGDYQYGRVTGSDELLDPFQLPTATRQQLRKRFGTTRTFVTGSVR